MDSSPSRINAQPLLPPIAGVKRPAPSLLPAFEPLSSSPGFPRPSKRQALSSPSQRTAFAKYPTPIPTSTTGILSSSPPKIHTARPGLQRTQSAVSERAPLSAVPSVTLPENGDELLMGRSSNSSHFQLSANRLVSRVHVKARYVAGVAPLRMDKVEIICNGWNGVKIHCHGRTYELGKGDSFTSETESAEIMLDVQDARVLVLWPRRSREMSPPSGTDTWSVESSPTRHIGAVSARSQRLQSSPLQVNERHRMASPESPTPGSSQPSIPDVLTSPIGAEAGKAIVEVYEDAPSPKHDEEHIGSAGYSQLSTQAASQAASQPVALDCSQSSALSELSEPDEADDPDEENDPIIHSFGPFGADISSRMATFSATSPTQVRGHTTEDDSPFTRESSQPEATKKADTFAVVNHVINQLAFSRLSSTPLSVILNHLPSELKSLNLTRRPDGSLSRGDLHQLLVATPCIGAIHREGKDAAGQPLESEYYYIPDEDNDEQRRAAVVDGLRKPSLRNCRKQHKQYYWKRPRTP